jgi:hypothetical protein
MVMVKNTTNGVTIFVATGARPFNQYTNLACEGESWVLEGGKAGTGDGASDDIDFLRWHYPEQVQGFHRITVLSASLTPAPRYIRHEFTTITPGSQPTFPNAIRVFCLGLFLIQSDLEYD